MHLRSILLNVDIANPDSPALRYAVDLAGQFDAGLIGVASDQPHPAYSGFDGTAAIDLYTIERSDIEAQLKRAEEAFHSLVPPTLKTQFRAFVAQPTSALIESAVAADLIVTASRTTTTFDEVQATNLGELVLASGRPVIDVAQSARTATLDRICIGWKDTREARRAVSDALPLLRRAGQVRAVTVDEGDYAGEKADLDALQAWLKSHGVTADCEVITNPEGFVDVLESTALAWNSDLLVVGGYGHSRMREWLFGGVTRRILGANSLNRFLSN